MNASPVDIETLSSLIPLKVLNKDNLKSLMNNAELIQLPAGKDLFNTGDLDKRTLYLLMGEIQLSAIDNDGDETLLSAGQQEADHPIAPCQPRQRSAIAITDIEVISFDSATLDIMLTWNQEAGSYEVEEDISEDSDWMMRLLNNNAFYDVPPANIHTVFTQMQPISLNRGDRVITQGQSGDYFYAIQSGSCQVIRETSRKPHGIKLAELKAGDSFGEEALISDEPRNATVIMLTDGVLMRLDKKDFISLLTAPSLEQLDLKHAKQRIKSGATWLDVRLPSEFNKMHIKGSINIPLFFLRSKANNLDPKTVYITVCDSGSRSSAATFLLKERGFKTAILKNGLTGAKINKR